MTARTAVAILVCAERIEIPTFNDEFVPVQDGGPCTEPAVAKLIIKHGDGCDCGGYCLLDPYTGKPVAPWTEVRLICADHLDQYGHAAPPDHGTSEAASLIRLDADHVPQADSGIARPGTAQGARCDDPYCSGVYQRRPRTQFERTDAGFSGVMLRCPDCGWDSAEFSPINPH